MKSQKRNLKPKFVFAPKRSHRVSFGGKEILKHDVEVLQIEKALYYPDMAVTTWLVEIKGYTIGQRDALMQSSPAPEWVGIRDKILSKITDTMVTKHLALMAEVNDQHVKASKLTMAKAIEMLAKLPVMTEMFPKKKGKAFKLGLRSIDLLNCASSIEKAQVIYRRAMGLPNDGAGLEQIVQKIEQLQREAQPTNIQNNLTINVNDPKSLEERLAKELTYSDIMEEIQIRRNLRRLKAQNEEKANVNEVQVGEGTPRETQ